MLEDQMELAIRAHRNAARFKPTDPGYDGMHLEAMSERAKLIVVLCSLMINPDELREVLS